LTFETYQPCIEGACWGMRVRNVNYSLSNSFVKTNDQSLIEQGED